jgi:hypothetical protein
MTSQDESLPFSWRFGFRPLPDDAERRQVTGRLRVELWTALRHAALDDFEDRRKSHLYRDDHFRINITVEEVLTRICCVQLHPRKREVDGWTSTLHAWWAVADWHDLLGAIELFGKLLGDSACGRIEVLVNETLARNLSIWRMVSGRFVPIIDPQELQAIDDAVNLIPWTDARTHIGKALDYLGDRQSPDHENAIKESISAVEAAVRIIILKPSVTLGDGLKELKKQRPDIPSLLIDSWEKLYAYTSDAPAVRHGGKPGHKASGEEARVAVVTCSAILNYLAVKASHGGANP